MASNIYSFVLVVVYEYLRTANTLQFTQLHDHTYKSIKETVSTSVLLIMV